MAVVGVFFLESKVRYQRMPQDPSQVSVVALSKNLNNSRTIYALFVDTKFSNLRKMC